MKNKAIILAALLLSAGLFGTMAHATVLGYYEGEASPGRLKDSSGSSHDLVIVIGSVQNPSSPVPVPEGSLWLAGDATGGSYLLPPTTLFTSTTVTCEAWVRDNLAVGLQNMAILQWDDSDSNQLTFAVTKLNGAGNSTITLKDIDGTDQFTPIVLSGNVSHLVRLECGAQGVTSSRVLVDGAVAVTFTRAAANFTANEGAIGGAPGHGGTSQYEDAVMVGNNFSDVYPGPGIPTATPTSTGTATTTPTVSPTNPFTLTVTKTITKTRTVTTTRTPTPTVTPTGYVGTLSFNTSIANQVYCTWPGTNINVSGSWLAYVEYGPSTSYGKQASGGYDPVNNVFFATVPQPANPNFHARGVVGNAQGTFRTSDTLIYGPGTNTPTRTASQTRTVSATISPTRTATRTPTFTPTAGFTNIATVIATPGQIYVSWQCSNVNVNNGLYVFLNYGSTSAYGYQVAGGYDTSSSTFFATIPQGAGVSGLHYQCGITTSSQGTLLSVDQVIGAYTPTATRSRTLTRSPTPSYTSTYTRTASATRTASVTVTVTRTSTP